MKRKILKRPISLVALSLLLSLFVSCGTQSDIVIHTGKYAQSSQTENTTEPVVSEEGRILVVINKSSMIFHLPDCIYASRMSEENRLEIEVESVEYLTEHGYAACGKCAGEYKQ